MTKDIAFENWGYSKKERERARAHAEKFVTGAHGMELWYKLPTVAAWYAKSPYPEDIEQLLDLFITRLYTEFDLVPTAEDEALAADDDIAWEEKRLDNAAVESILRCVSDNIPTEVIAAFADTVKDIADVANQYLELVVREDLLDRHDLNDLVKQFAGVAGFVDYFTGGDRSIRSDGVETLLGWFPDDSFVHDAFGESVVRGLEYDRRAGTLDQRLPWLRWFFDRMDAPNTDSNFWRSVFTMHPMGLAMGLLHLAWTTDMPFEDLARAMWYHQLARLAEVGVDWDASEVLDMGCGSELVGRLLCGDVANKE